NGGCRDEQRASAWALPASRVAGQTAAGGPSHLQYGSFADLSVRPAGGHGHAGYEAALQAIGDGNRLVVAESPGAVSRVRLCIPSCSAAGHPQLHGVSFYRHPRLVLVSRLSTTGH